MREQHFTANSIVPAPPSTVESLERRVLLSAAYYVSVTGDDASPGTDPSQPWRHVQKAFDAATPGSTVTVMPGRYNEKVTLNVSGNETDGYITFQAGTGGPVVISGKGLPGRSIVSIANRSYVRIVGFEIRDNLKVVDGSGVRLIESNHHVEIRNNKIHTITGTSAMGITVYGTDPVRGISDVVIDGNEVYRCQPAPSEAISVDGNVHDFAVTNNYVHEVNNIGIDIAGGYGISPDPATDGVRNGVVSGNRVTNARWRGRGQFAAGIYVDGARDLVVEKNTTWRNDVGVIVGSLHAGVVASNVTVRNNVIHANTKAGLIVGGRDESVGRVQNCQVVNNTLYRNATRRPDHAEIKVQWASNNRIANNVISGNKGAVLVEEGAGATDNASDHNVYYSPGGTTRARFTWAGKAYTGWDALRSGSFQEFNSVFADPLLTDPRRGNWHLAAGSPALNAGDPLFAPAAGETDIDGHPRLLGERVDAGADEAA